MCPPCLETNQLHSFLLRRHISSVFASFLLLLYSYAISLRITWVVLIKEDDASDAQIIDGQQRLTTLTMLLAALRSLIKSEYAESLTSFLCEKGNVIIGTPKRYRLRLRERDAQFFLKYIQDEGGIEELKQLQGSLLAESQRNIRDNTLGFIRELRKLSEEQLIALTQFIVNCCFLIVVPSPLLILTRCTASFQS